MRKKVDGVTDIFEERKMEGIFDDTKLTDVIGPPRQARQYFP
jgi:hypothetical protein